MSTDEATGWLPISDLEMGFNENKSPATDELTGKEISLWFPDRQALKYVFQDARRLTWNLTPAGNREKPRDETYEAIRIDKDLYFVDFVKKEQPRESVSMSLNFNTRQSVVINCTVPTRKEASLPLLQRMSRDLDLSPMKVEILAAGISKPALGQMAPHVERTEDLIGKRVRYIYSRRHTYEHIYLNHRFYCWQCLEGPEKGTADTDICDYIKIAPEIYLFIWKEKIVPTVGIVLINFKNMRSNGKIFGLDIPSGRAVNFTVGALAEVVSETKC